MPHSGSRQQLRLSFTPTAKTKGQQDFRDSYKRLHFADKREKLTIAVSAENKAILERLALDFGQKWGEKLNISALMTAIAQG